MAGGELYVLDSCYFKVSEHKDTAKREPDRAKPE